MKIKVVKGILKSCPKGMSLESACYHCSYLKSVNLIKDQIFVNCNCPNSIGFILKEDKSLKKQIL